MIFFYHFYTQHNHIKLFNSTNFIRFYFIFYFFQLTVVAKDISNKPNSATCSVVINIVRNQFAPVFGKSVYNVVASDTQRAGTELKTLDATDQDLNVPLSANVSILDIILLIYFLFFKNGYGCTI